MQTPPPDLPRRRHRRRGAPLRRAGFIALLCLVSLAALPWLLVALFVDVGTLQAGIETGVLQTTGRSLSFGKLRMLRSLPPTLAAEDVTLANPRGASRPAMLRVPYAEAEFAIVPLLFGRLQVTSLVLSRPDLALESSPAGTGNWQFLPVPADAAAPPPPASQRPRWRRRHAAGAQARMTLERLRVREGRLAWRDAAGDWATVELRRVDADASGMAGPAEVTAVVAGANRSATLRLTTGRLDRLREAGADAGATPWPVHARGRHPGGAGQPQGHARPAAAAARLCAGLRRHRRQPGRAQRVCCTCGCRRSAGWRCAAASPTAAGRCPTSRASASRPANPTSASGCPG